MQINFLGIASVDPMRWFARPHGAKEAERTLRWSGYCRAVANQPSTRARLAAIQSAASARICSSE